MLKIREELINNEKHSYSLDELVLPADGIDCGEGCNPYGFPKQILQVIENFDYSRLSLYPHCQNAYDGIMAFWKDLVEIKKENIILVDGSDFVMYNINSVFNTKGAKVLGFAPQYTDYVANVILTGMEYVPCYLKQDDNFKLDINQLCDMLTAEYSILYIDNPNNPTGQSFSLKELEPLIAKGQKLGVCVIIDEAYGDFITREESATTLLSRYDNLLIMRTLSKGFGLAGLRAGYALGSAFLIDCMQKVTNPYVVSEMTREIMGVALSGDNEISSHLLKFEKAKLEITSACTNHLHMAHTDNRVPICLLYHDNKNINLIMEFFKRGILTVPGEEFIGIEKNFVRLRIPKEEYLPKLLQVIKEIDKLF